MASQVPGTWQASDCLQSTGTSSARPEPYLDSRFLPAFARMTGNDGLWPSLFLREHYILSLDK